MSGGGSGGGGLRAGERGDGLWGAWWTGRSVWY